MNDKYSCSILSDRLYFDVTFILEATYDIYVIDLKLNNSTSLIFFIHFIHIAFLFNINCLYMKVRVYF